MNSAYLLLGGNIGNREKSLAKVLLEIEKIIGKITRKSSIYETKAWGNEKQPDFLNRAILVETKFSPQNLLKEALKIEKSLGRLRSEKKWEERIIDIDILFYNDFVLNEENLEIPHPHLHLRRFALEPLNEIAPDFVHPVFTKTVSELLEECEDKSSIKIMNDSASSPMVGEREGLPYNFIAIEGNIGSGKTSLAEKIAKQFNAKLMLEQFAENPFLPKFYENREKYAFPLEMSFLAERYNQVKEELSAKDLFHPFIVSDYVISKCLVFAKINLQNDEYGLYTKLFNIIYPSLPKPDLLVYLYLTTEQLLANILKRGRNYEQTISAEYLQNIQESYFEFIKQQQDLRVLIIDTSRIDFVNSENDYEKITDIIHQPHPLGVSRFLL